MSLFKKKEVPTSEEVQKIAMMGRELRVNPSPQHTLARLEGRLKRVRKFLAENKVSDEKRLSMERTGKRLELEIILRKGEL
jgi:hypothetical protein